MSGTTQDPKIFEHTNQPPSPNVPPNPFYHRTNSSWYQNLKVGLLFVPALIFRVIPMLFCLLMAWLFAIIGTIGMSDEKLRSKPLTRWRKFIRWFLSRLWMRGLFFFAGFYWVKIIGKRASRTKAPILVVAPHSSPVDNLALILLGSPSVVSKTSVGKIPFINKLVAFTQPIYVSRDDIISRLNAVQAIQRRAQSPLDWPQIYIYPEGTTTNRSSLISFKSGAFVPGVPVQPLIIRYSNWNDTITWTFDGMTVIELLSRSLTQFYLKCSIEFLPVYYPTIQEEENSELYAENVRCYMARKLGIPVSKYRISDGLIMDQIMINKHEIVNKLKILDVLRRQTQQRSISLDIELNILRILEEKEQSTEATKVSFHEFKQDFNFIMEQNPEYVGQLFRVFDTEELGAIDLREYLIYSLLLNSNLSARTIAGIIFKLYNESDSMAKCTFLQIMQGLYRMPKEYVQKLCHLDSRGMSFEDFYSKIHKPIEHLMLYALEVKGMISVYPTREFELKL